MRGSTVGGDRSFAKPVRNVVAVAGDTLRAEMFEALLDDPNDYGVVYVESIGEAYRLIKRVTPYLVIVFCEIDDVAACALLSTLKADKELASVLVLTCASLRMQPGLDYLVSEVLQQSPSVGDTMYMN